MSNKSELPSVSTPMLTPIDPKQLSRIYMFSAYSRPSILYVTSAVFMMFATVIVIQILRGMENISSTSALMMALVGALATLAGGAIAGRTYEKSKGQSLDAIAHKEELVPSPILAPNGMPIPASASEEYDPLAELQNMDLSEFMPKVADDTPDLDHVK